MWRLPNTNKWFRKFFSIRPPNALSNTVPAVEENLNATQKRSDCNEIINYLPTEDPCQLVHVTTEQQFRERLNLAGDKLVVVDFYADWCQPCQRIAPRLEGMAKNYPNVDFLKVNVDELNEVAEQYQVATLPTFLLLKREAVVSTLQGSDYHELLSLVERHD